MATNKTKLAEILAQVPAARRRDARERAAGKRAISASYHRASGRIMVELSNGFVLGFPAASIPALAHATRQQLAAVTVSPGGIGLRWDELDVDLSVPGLLLESVGQRHKMSELARLAGRVTTPEKAAASRANGAKGGRPRKSSAR